MTRTHRTLRRWASATLLGLTISSSTYWADTARADVTNLVSLTTFEVGYFDDGGNYVPDGRPRGGWTYNYQWGFDPNPNVNPWANSYFTYPPDVFTNTADQINFDTSAYTPVPSGAGFGIGRGAGINWNSYDPAVIVWPTNRADYVLSFDAKVEGLLPATTTASVEMQLQFDVPDDTLQPADANGDADRLLQVNKSVSMGTNWQHYEYTLDKGTLGGGSDEALALYADRINNINYNVNVHMPGDAFGFDGDNAIYLDNIKLQVVSRAPVIRPPTVEFTIADWNFDDRGTWYDYGYEWSQNANHLAYTVSHTAAGFGTAGSQAWVFQFDNTSFANGLPQWAGGGAGTEGSFTTGYFDTTNLSSYKLYFDARVEGLAEGKTSTPLQMQYRLRAPDNTLQPADDNGDPDTFFQVNFDVNVKSNWQTFAFTLDKGTFDEANFDRWARFYPLTSSLQPQVQFAGAASDFGTDADNALIIDNLKLVRVMVGLPALNITTVNGNVTVTWSGPAKLQGATSLQGAFTDIPGAVSPYTVPGGANSPRFFRTQWVPTP